MKKTMYRITLFAGANGLAETLAILAAKSNGSEKKYTVHDLKNVAEGQIILYPSINENTICEVLDDHTLHLDRKVGENYETVLILQEITVMDLSGEEAPTLSRYDAQTIINELEQNKPDQN